MKNLLGVFVFVLLSNSALAADYGNGQNDPASVRPQSFADWLQDVRDEAIDEGVAAITVDLALQQVSLDERVIERDQNQPETTQSFAGYSKHTVSTDRVADGRTLLKKYLPTLKKMYQQYGVPPEIVVALWGMESNFGRNSGEFETVSALATLAYESRRGDFFRKQLISALRILDEEHMDVGSLRGSWAGAMGQPQFMPTTYLHYAVDYDGKGRRDIWNDEGDVFASIANYLSVEGWRPDAGWGRPVKLTKNISEMSIGMDHKRTVTEWGKLGVRAANGKSLPKSALTAALVQPDGFGGRSFLVYDNFRALMRWNRSTYFAASIGLLADKIASR